MRLALFDLDGVLVDSEPIVNRAQAETLSEVGFPIGEAELLERFCGTSDRDMYAVLEGERGRALPPDYRERIARRIERDYRAGLRAIAGVDAVLDSLAAPVCVASSSEPDRIRLALACAGLLDRFAPALFSAAAMTRGKPAPDLFLYAAAMMGAAPEDCVVVEDSLAGIAAARAAGMRAIGFCGGGHCRPGHADMLAGVGAHAVVAGMMALPALLQGIAPGPRYRHTGSGQPRVAR